MGIRTLFTTPPTFTAPAPAPMMVAPSRPPINAWLLELGRPCCHVIRFHAIAPMRAAATIACVVVSSLTSPLPIVTATAVPANAPMKLNAVAMRMAQPGRQSPRRDRGGDRVGGVVEAVGVVECDRQQDDEDEHDRDAIQRSGSFRAGLDRSTGLIGRVSRPKGYPPPGRTFTSRQGPVDIAGAGWGLCRP